MTLSEGADTGEPHGTIKRWPPIERAKAAADNIGAARSIFLDAQRTVEAGFGTREVRDYHLTRYAAYLIAMNGDPRKPEVPAAQPLPQLRAGNRLNRRLTAR